MDRGACWAKFHRVAKSWTRLKRFGTQLGMPQLREMLSCMMGDPKLVTYRQKTSLLTQVTFVCVCVCVCVCVVFLLLLSRFSRVRLCATHRRQSTRLPRPWDSPGKNTGVGCHFFLQWIKVKNESKVAQLCPTLRDPMDFSLPGSSIHGIFRPRVLGWGAIAFSNIPIIVGIFDPFVLQHFLNTGTFTFH